MSDDADAGEVHPAEARERPGEGGPRTALVTRCGSPVGRATALAFREEGWRVYATAPEGTDLGRLADRGCLTDELNPVDGGAARRVVTRATAEAGRLDCAVAVAGPGPLGPVEEVPPEAVRAGLERDVVGPATVIRRALPHMRERGDGTVVVVASVHGRVAAPGTGVASGGAAAAGALCDALRPEVAEHGVSVSLVEHALVGAGADAGVESDGRADDGPAAEYGPDDDRPTEYGRVRKLVADVRAVAGDGPGSVPPARVGAAAVNAASATQPAPRYPVGPLAGLLAKARYLPASWRDAGFRLLLRRA